MVYDPAIVIKAYDLRNDVAPFKKRYAPSGKVPAPGADIQDGDPAQTAGQNIGKKKPTKLRPRPGKKTIGESKLSERSAQPDFT